MVRSPPQYVCSMGQLGSLSRRVLHKQCTLHAINRVEADVSEASQGVSAINNPPPSAVTAAQEKT